MENTYYTPTIEEFHVRFNYEEKDSMENWQKMEFSPLKKPTEINVLISIGRIRVKNLDREDFKSFDWDYIKGDRSYLFSKMIRNFRHYTKQQQIDIVYNKTSHWACISLIEKGTSETHEEKEVSLFLGKIKNKSELKRVLTQIGVL